MLVGDLAVSQVYRFFEERYLNLEKKIKKILKIALEIHGTLCVEYVDFEQVFTVCESELLLRC